MILTIVSVAVVSVLICVGLAALLLTHRTRRLTRAMEVLMQVDEERRARRSAERHLAQAQHELRNKTAQLEQTIRERKRSSGVASVHAAVDSLIPSGAGPIAVVSHGDDELLRFPRHIGWHFPQTDDGVYAGYHPADSDAAIQHLEELRRRGAMYLLIPESSSWWLTHYAGFLDHLGTKYRMIEPGTGNGIAAFVDLT